MKVIINAKTINEVLNADVINIDSVRKLGSEDQQKLITELLTRIEHQLDELSRNPKPIETEQLQKMSEQAKAELSKKSNESTGEKVNRTIDTIKQCVGGASGILMDLVKMAQIIGIQTLVK